MHNRDVELRGCGVMVWGIFLAHFGPINTHESLNSTAYLNIVADCVLPFMARIDHLIISYTLIMQYDGFKTIQTPNPNPVEHFLDVVEQEIHNMKLPLKKSAAIV